MQLETYPISINVGRQWKQTDTASTSTPIHNFTFLYIGKNEEFQNFSTYFQSGILTEDYIQAQVLIEKFNSKALPDVIFIDLPLNRIDFQGFHAFLKDKNLLSVISLIYSERNLDSAKIKFLKQRGFVDDVVSFDSPEINYGNKISFLKKIKTHQQTLTVNKKHFYTVHRAKWVGFKRLFDIIGSVIAVLFFLPLFVLIAFVIRLESKGPIIYTSVRAGKGFRVFKFFKFRTMVTDADQRIEEFAHLNQYGQDNSGAMFLKIENDPRVTRLGKFLRKTSLDELPQFFNVLKGDMSLVGNRPLPLYEASTLTTNEFVERFMAPAGITGLWQIKKRGRAKMSTEERINLDIVYARTASPILDLWIIAKTPTALFQKTSA